MDLNNKRLLVLGCTNNAPDVESFAKKYGVQIVVAGKTFSREIQAITNEMYVVDIVDRDALAQLILEKNIRHNSPYALI